MAIMIYSPVSNSLNHPLLKSLGEKGDVPKTFPEYVLAKKIRRFGIRDW